MSKAVPIAGGVISGSMTLVTLRTQAARLTAHLRLIPPPGMDAEMFQAVLDSDETAEPRPGKFSSAIKKARRPGQLSHGRRRGWKKLRADGTHVLSVLTWVMLVEKNAEPSPARHVIPA